MTTNIKKVEETREKLKQKIDLYNNTTPLKKAQLKKWTFGEDHTPFADEILAEGRVIFGVEYDDQGNVGAVYETDINGKRINIPFSAEIKTAAKNNLVIRERIDATKKREAKMQAKPEEEKDPKRLAKRRVVRKTSPVRQSERLG